jgi:anaerobic selenocysteine-containing dehydrogenase
MVEEKRPTSHYPFWLITPHHPYALNSQFHFLRLSDEEEAVARIHPKAARELGIVEGEVIKIFNQQACIKIKAVYSTQVPKDIIMIYQGWYPHSKVNVNDLVTSLQTETRDNESALRNIPFYDTFVNVRKL